MSSKEISSQATLFGHPTGLYTLFFAEMWERFSYYGMRALLIFYMTKGFLGFKDSQAYGVYGAYTSLVYMTPFIGGLLADRILGKRLAVVLGGVLMAAGHLLMTVESEWPFYFALALLIAGNGFFKPNISTTVGSLYGDGDKRRDNGFNIFYMGINLGAAISPLLCGYVGETYGWHYGFGLATIGMLVGLAVFVMPTIVTSLLIFTAAAATAFGLVYFRPDNVWAIGINAIVAVCLLTAAICACIALSRGGLPKWAGARPDGVDSRHDWKVYLGTAVAIPVFALLVSGFSPFMTTDEKVPTNKERLEERIALAKEFNVAPEIVTYVEEAGVEGELKARADAMTLLSKGIIHGTTVLPLEKADKRELAAAVMDDDGKVVDIGGTKLEVGKTLSKEIIAGLTSNNISEVTVVRSEDEKSGFGKIASIFFGEVSKPAGLVLTVLGLLAFGYLIKETFLLDPIARDRMFAALFLIFFQMLFFAFFEQAGSSMSVFTDRNVDRVRESEVVTSEMVGQTIRIQPTQAQLGFMRGEKVFTLDDLTGLRKLVEKNPEYVNMEIDWPVTEGNVGMGISKRTDELPASIFQSFNAIFILFFALIFNWFWDMLQRNGWNPSAPIKFSMGLLQVGLGFGALYMGAKSCNDQGMVSVVWLILAYLLHTTGELCLSPVGLSAMTKLSPRHLVSTLMGSWFLATAFSQYLAGIISQFTSVEHGGGESGGFPPPSETVNIYGDVFYEIMKVAVISAIACLLLSPILQYWMHEKHESTDSEVSESPEA